MVFAKSSGTHPRVALGGCISPGIAMPSARCSERIFGEKIHEQRKKLTVAVISEVNFQSKQGTTHKNLTGAKYASNATTALRLKASAHFWDNAAHGRQQNCLMGGKTAAQEPLILSFATLLQRQHGFIIIIIIRSLTVPMAERLERQ